MGCRESSTKERDSAMHGTGSPRRKGEQQQHDEADAATSEKPAKDPMSPAAQIANASPPKSAMKKRPAAEEPVVAMTPVGSQRCEGRVVGSLLLKDPEDDVSDETNVMDRSFVKEDLTGSFRNLSFVTEKGDCRIEKGGVMAPSTLKIPASSSDKSSSRAPSEATLLSPHSSDDQLVLVCMDCGREIGERECGVLCPLTAKLHG